MSYIDYMFFFVAVSWIADLGVHVRRIGFLGTTSVTIPREVVQNVCIFEHVSMVSTHRNFIVMSEQKFRM